MEDHVPRHAQMGAWVLINDRWYYRMRDKANQTVDVLARMFRLAEAWGHDAAAAQPVPVGAALP